MPHFIYQPIIRIAAASLALRAENQQKKTHFTKKQKQAMFFSLLRFQLFVDLFVTSKGQSSNFLKEDIDLIISKSI